MGCDFSKIGEEIKRLRKAKVNIVHWDVMDGHFVPNISFGPGVIKSLRSYTNLPFEAHLMISDPGKCFKVFAESGADTIIFHIEIDDNILNLIDNIKGLGKKVGIAINPETSIEEVFPYLKYLDVVIIMTVNPGFGGQPFMESQIYKIIKIKDRLKDIGKNDLEVEIDGGINFETIKFVKNAGADICVSGSFLFSSEDILETVGLLKMGSCTKEV